MTTTTKCCTCACNATCQLKGARATSNAPASSQDASAQIVLVLDSAKTSATCFPSERPNHLTLQAFFQPLAASASLTGNILQAPASLSNYTTAKAPSMTAGAAPAVMMVPRTMQRAGDIGKDDGNGIAPAAKPAAKADCWPWRGTLSPPPASG
jgi:hypothetical protein